MGQQPPSTILPNWLVTVSFSEAFGRSADIGHFTDMLRQFNRTDVIVCLAKLNCVLQTWRTLSVARELDEKIARDFFSKAVIQRVRAASTGLPRRLFFPRLSIMAEIKLALQVCENSGRPVETAKDVGLLFAGCLIFNDGLPGTVSGPGSMPEIISDLLPLYDFTPRSAYEADVCRSLRLFETIAPDLLKSNPKGIDFQKLFTDVLGADPRTFAEFCFAVGAQYVKLTEAALTEAPRLFFIEKDYFSQTRLPPALTDHLVGRTAISEEELAAKVRCSPAGPPADLTLLQLHPLLRHVDGRLYCLDVNFLLDKAGRGLYWTLRDAAPVALHAQLPGCCGEVFGAYVTFLLRSAKLKETRYSYLPSPRFSNGDEAFDGCAQEGSQLVIFEFKSSVLRADAKYGGNSQLLQDEVDKKFVRGDRDGPKGVAQLAAGIKRWLNGEDLEGIKRESVSTIYPVVVVLERGMTVPWMAEYLNQGLRTAVPTRLRGKTITRLYVVDIENLERLIPFMEHVPISDMLDSYFDEHVRRERHIEYAVKPENIPVLSNVTASEDIVSMGFREFRRGMAMHLFGVDPDPETGDPLQFTP